MIKLLKILLAEFWEKYHDASISQVRYAQFKPLKNKIKVAMGMRRVGKTYFLIQTIREIIDEHKLPIQRILYLNFEDDRLLPCSQATLRKLLEGFYQLYPENHDHTCYLFLDEIQNVEDWALVIRRFFDTKKVEIYLSGSSAKLLSKEIHTSLRGRSVASEIWPFSFREYLEAHQIDFQPNSFSTKTRDQLLQQLSAYLQEGGFPESTGLSIADRRQLLQDYVELVMVRDIIERYGITNISLIKYLVNTMIKHAGGTFSVNKFANDVKSQGLSGAKNTIHDYLLYIEDAYLAFTVPLYNESLRKVQSNPKKLYVVDTGLVNAYSFSVNNNYGHLFENLVYLELRRKGHDIYYYLTEERYEIDFFTIDPLGQQHIYQVVWDTADEKTMAREQRALQKAEKELGVTGELITPEIYVEKWLYS